MKLKHKYLLVFLLLFFKIHGQTDSKEIKSTVTTQVGTNIEIISQI